MRVGPLLLLALPLLHADTLTFATYLGGGGNEVVGSVTTDPAGNIYIAGRTDSPDFPLKNAIQPVSHSYSQIFIAKFSPAGDLLYSTYFGGSANDLATGIAVDPAGNVYVTGVAPSLDFPVANAIQGVNHGGTDAFVLKLDPAGNVVYATYFGGKFNDHAMAIAADAAGNAYITGRTESPDFPITAGAYQRTPGGYMPGYTFISAFAVKLDPAGLLVYSTYLGGNGANVGWGIAVDAQGQAHIAGETSALDFPTTAGALQTNGGRTSTLGVGSDDGFLTKLSADGSSLIYSTIVGGPGADAARSVTLDSAGNAYLTGTTTDGRLPIVNGPQPYMGGDIYRVSADGGATFTPRHSGLTGSQVNSIVFDRNHPGLIYAGTPQGVFRSSDGAATWTSSGLDRYNVVKVELDPSLPGTVYAGTYYGGGVFRSTDGGDTWNSMTAGFPGDPGRSTFETMAAEPTGSGALYVMLGFGGGIGSGYNQPLFRVTDGGATWTFAGQGLMVSPAAITAGADGALFAATPFMEIFHGVFSPPGMVQGAVYRHTADNWVSLGLTDDVHALAFQSGTLYAAGQRFFRSTDGGATWTTTSLPGSGLAYEIAVDPRNPSMIYLQTRGATNRLLVSSDGGDTFADAGPLPDAPLAMAVSPADSSLHLGLATAADAFVAEFDPAGSLLFSTFFGDGSSERGDGVAVDASGAIYIAAYRDPLPYFGYSGRTIVARLDGSGYTADLGGTTASTVLGMPSRAITIAPDGSIVAVMIATEDGLPLQNATQQQLNGASDVYLIKWKPDSTPDKL